MSDRVSPQVAVVDYEMGNLFSVKHACEQVGLQASITNDKRAILFASAVILPGVGAFGVAIEALTRLDLVEPLRDIAASGKPLIGICLGMQLLMTESHEFGRHRGLGLLEGEVVRLAESMGGERCVKVPQVGWNRIRAMSPDGSPRDHRTSSWFGTPLDGLPNGTFMYFVHSYYCRPAESDAVLSVTDYAGNRFCSAVRRGNTIGFQFHPERSGPNGVHIYRNLARFIIHQS